MSQPNESESTRVHGVEFCVDVNPYCVWDPSLPELNKHFVRSLAPQYFTYQAEVFAAGLDNEGTAQFAATALRAAYGHALETAFAVTFAALQSPKAVFAWLQKYQRRHLVELVGKVGRRAKINHAWSRDFSMGWKDVADLFLARMPPELKSTDGKLLTRADVIEGYFQVLALMATDFLSADVTDEYHDCKHGFRISPGGFTLGMREEVTSGVENPDAPLHILRGSQFGATTYSLEEREEAKHHFGVAQRSKNWVPEADARKLQVISAWIGCVQGALRVAYGDTDPPIQWYWFADSHMYIAPWTQRPMINNFRLSVGSFKIRQPSSKDEILARYADCQPNQQ